MRYLLPLLLLAAFCAKGQNLCPNGNFEQYSACPSAISQTSLASGWFNYYQSPDYFHTCGVPYVGVPSNFHGYQHTASGNAYCGAFTSLGTGEFLGHTIPALTVGGTYEVSLSLVLSNWSGTGHNRMGVFFYQNGSAPIYPSPISDTAQISFGRYGAITDTQIWTRVIDTFVADSSYDHMAIGAFPNSYTHIGSGASYYYIDSVVIKLIKTNFIFNDTALCQDDSIHIPYTVNPGASFASGNNFILQLSNATGSFALPLNIGTITSTTSGTIHGFIPLTVPPGSGYRIRMISTLPADTSGVNGKNILIKPNPAPIIVSNTPICEGNTLTLNATALSGSTYSWTGPASFTAGQQNNSITSATLLSSGDYIVTTTLNGCTGKDTIAVLVKPIPAIPSPTSNSPTCSGNALNLAATSFTTGVSYNWSGPLAYASTLQNPTIPNTTTAMSGTYSVNATLNGCTSAAATTTATVNLTPATPTAGSNSPVCAGGSLNFSAVSTTPAVNYNWTGPSSFTSNTQNPAISPAPLNGSGTYSVTAELNGCTSAAGSTNVVVNNVSSLGVYPSPNDTVCINNANASFVAVPFNAGTAPQYQWYKNNNLIGGATNISYPASGIADGDSFYCRMTVTGLCADPLVLYSNKLGMTVLPLTTGPSVTITADPGTLLSPWQLVKFTAVAINAGVLPKYQWKRNSQDVIGATSDVWSANNLSNLDTISCVVTSGVWCASPADAVSNRMVVNIKTGIKDIDADKQLQLYPNPNNGSFVVYLPTAPSRARHMSIEVVDALGRTVYSTQQLQIIDHKSEIILPSSIANGVYMLKLTADEKLYHARFTVGR